MWVNNMKRYFKIYIQFLWVSLLNLLAYRSGFYSHLVGSTIWGIFHYISIFVLTYRIQSVYGWTKPELFILTATFGGMWGLFRFFFVKNFHEFSGTVLSGRLDGLLIKPIDSQFLMSLWQVRYDEFVRVFMGTAFLIYVINAYNIHVTPVGVFMYFFLIIFAIVSSYCFWFSCSTIIIWFPRLSNLIELLYSFSGIMRNPPDIMQRFGISTVLIITPILFAISVPTRVLVGKASIAQILWLIVFTILFFMFTRAFWKYALRSYTSVNN